MEMMRVRIELFIGNIQCIKKINGIINGEYY